MYNTAIHRQSRLSGASLHRTGTVAVPMRNSWLSDKLYPGGGESFFENVPDEMFRDLPLGIAPKRHEYGGGCWCERVNVAHSTQNWGLLNKGDKVLVQVGHDQWQLKIVAKKPWFFKYFVGPCRDELLEAYWIASVRSITRAEIISWLHEMDPRELALAMRRQSA